MTRSKQSAVLACGAWLKNAACLLVEGRPGWSAVHGDLNDPAACLALEASVRQFLNRPDLDVQGIAHDLHPDFFSTQLAVQIAGELGVPAIGVQHHHAHIATVVAEHGLTEPVIGLALDGVGLGTDGQAWGGELLWVHGADWQRLGHLKPLALPGGDRAAREPWRMAASVLHAMGRGNDISAHFGARVGAGAAIGVQRMLAGGLNCPASSSTGRWFDAAAGALGLSVRQSDEAEAAKALETAAARWLSRHPEEAGSPGAVIDADNRLDLLGLMPALFDAGADRVDAAAAGFHHALADALADWAQRAANAKACRTICLGGGCFFNRVLRERTVSRLRAAGLKTCLPLEMGCGDAGLALGQAWVAAQRLARADLPEEIEKETQTCA